MPMWSQNLPRADSTIRKYLPYPRIDGLNIFEKFKFKNLPCASNTIISKFLFFFSFLTGFLHFENRSSKSLSLLKQSNKPSNPQGHVPGPHRQCMSGCFLTKAKKTTNSPRSYILSGIWPLLKHLWRPCSPQPPMMAGDLLERRSRPLSLFALVFKSVRVFWGDASTSFILSKYTAKSGNLLKIIARTAAF